MVDLTLIQIQMLMDNSVAFNHPKLFEAYIKYNTYFQKPTVIEATVLHNLRIWKCL